MTVNQLVGGSFQNILTQPLSNGYLLFKLDQDAIANGTAYIAAGTTFRIDLDSSGNVQTSPPQSIWPNDALVPVNGIGENDQDTYYFVSGYSSAGQLVWGSNAQQVLSTPSPFDLGTWIPGVVSITEG